MKKHKLLLTLVMVIFCCACGGQQTKQQMVVIPGGTISPNYAIGFDANYDPATDRVLPGYKIVTVAYTNNTMDTIQLDPLKDEWWLEDRTGKKIKAIINLRDKDPDLWAKLPKKLKIMVEYPLVIGVGSTETVDLFFSKKVNLGEFKSVIYKTARGQSYKILPREGS